MTFDSNNDVQTFFSLYTYHIPQLAGLVLFLLFFQLENF